MTALVNMLAAEVLTNIHSFVIVVPNHAGEDVYRFKTPVKVTPLSRLHAARTCDHTRLPSCETAARCTWKD